MDLGVHFEFAVSRRVPWEWDHPAFRSHLGDVRDHLDADHRISDLRVQSEAVEGRVTIDLVVPAADTISVADEARRVVGEAIRGAGAYHRGLLPSRDELRLRPDLAAWSGLRTPTWQLRTVALQTASQYLRAPANQAP